MRPLLTVLLMGVAFWAGVAHTESRRPVQPFKIVRPVPQPAVQLIPCTQHGREEWERTCRAKFRSALIKPKE